MREGFWRALASAAVGVIVVLGIGWLAWDSQQIYDHERRIAKIEGRLKP